METAAALARLGNRILSMIAAIFILIMLLYGGYSLWDTVMVYQGAFLSSDLLQFKPAEDAVESPTLLDLRAINSDVQGWLTIDGTHIDYPVVQGEDNDYYLKHSFEGESVNAGCIFMDCGASADWSDRNTFVFGHNMRDSSMFGTFKNLLKGTASCEENPYFYIYTEDKVYIYEIFSYYETRSNSDRFATFTSDASYDDYVQWATEHSLYASDADLSDRGNIVSLSTCYGSSGTKRRALIHGVLTETIDY